MLNCNPPVGIRFTENGRGTRVLGEESVMRYCKLIASCLLFCTLSVSTTLFAQTSTGEVNGTVTDASGAAVPGATIKLTNKATQIVTDATTNANGQYFVIH